MRNDEEWDLIRGNAGSPLSAAGMNLLRFCLLFGSAAVALALIAAPMLADFGDSRVASRAEPIGLDTISTGAVGNGGAYTIRRSVLQPSPNSVCVIRANGRRSGDC